MLTVEHEHYYTQLERILVELRTGREVTISQRGVDWYKIVPLGKPGWKSWSEADQANFLETQIDEVAKHNSALGWITPEGEIDVRCYDGVVIGLVMHCTKCTTREKLRSLIDEMLDDSLGNLCHLQMTMIGQERGRDYFSSSSKIGHHAA